ncbi:hypothetical protein QVD17_11890 [Tagetes erecta]|uniref:Uncharacterized protein n=1 Tax=Tagetes erecta TaxID=13708 RepID=A0AAD8P2L2_TARER|nr:hypothetical protein QVD17_11890 [Tagetes erecta]
MLPLVDRSLINFLASKGPKKETNKWKIRLQLTKPVTWPPLIWGVVCGAAASGNFEWTVDDVAKSIACMSSRSWPKLGIIELDCGTLDLGLRESDQNIYSQSKYESEECSGADIDGIWEEGLSCVANF